MEVFVKESKKANLQCILSLDGKESSILYVALEEYCKAHPKTKKAKELLKQLFEEMPC